MAEIYDLRGLNCPLPVLKTQKRMRDMLAGEELWIETSDPLAVIDIPNFVRERGHALIKSEAVEGGGHRFLLKKDAGSEQEL
ncbi:sulfurtransferase TusA family protein [Ahrensia kielensis]|uniref:Sulfurtransferase TusA family protein n=1 Tax=Ahrensia kielensis TaxID=76980 RepID=A0ABU9T8Z9_9HYPH|nr:sulfurtransferase TusA family protein [Ahrensia kielensis]